MKKMISAIIAVMLITNSCFVAFAYNSDNNINLLSFNQNIYDENVVKKYGLGANPNDDVSNNMLTYKDEQTVPVNTCRNLASSCDLSNKPYFPPIGDQEWLGSCCSWATTYYQFGYQVGYQIAEEEGLGEDDEFTPLQFSPKFVYNLVNGGQNTGSSFYDNYDILETRGAALFSDFEPNTNTAPLEYREWCTNVTVQERALEHKVTNRRFHYIIDEDDFDPCPIVSPSSDEILIIKSLLSTNHILTFRTNYGWFIYNSSNPVYPDGVSNSNWIYDTVSNPSNNDKVCIMCNNNSPNGGNGTYHALSIVGYDDNIWYDYNHDGLQSPSEMGALKIANSHGTEYGNSGFMWVMYDALNLCSSNTGYNYSNRISVLDESFYYYIEVGKSNKDLLAMVTITQNDRSENVLSITTTDTLERSFFVFFKGGQFRYDGTDISQPQTATFALDYDTIFSGKRNWKTYQIIVEDLTSAYYTYISNITFVDRTGKTVLSDSNFDPINNSMVMFNYDIGMVGDVNNDGEIDILDVSLIQRHIAGTIILTNKQKLTADVNGDGIISNIDANQITQYCVENITTFQNGAFVYLGS